MHGNILDEKFNINIITDAISKSSPKEINKISSSSTSSLDTPILAPAPPTNSLDKENIQVNVNINGDEIKNYILDELRKDITLKVESYLSESIKKHCQLIIEKVAWDVIPRAAENLIKSELQRLSQKK